MGIKKLARRLPHKTRDRDIIIRYAMPIQLDGVGHQVIAAVYKRRKRDEWKLLKNPHKRLRHKFHFLPATPVTDTETLELVVEKLAKLKAAEKEARLARSSKGVGRNRPHLRFVSTTGRTGSDTGIPSEGHRIAA